MAIEFFFLRTESVTALDVGDAANISATEILSVAIAIVATDNAAISASEAVSLNAALTIADNAAIAATEAISTFDVPPIIVDIFDAGNISATETLIVTVLISAVDTAIISATEALTLLATLTLQDTATVSGSEVLSSFTTLILQDNAAISASEVPSLLVTFVVADTATIQGTESPASSRFVSVTDTINIAVTETINVTTEEIELFPSAIFIPEGRGNRWVPSGIDIGGFNMREIVRQLTKQPSEDRTYGVDFINFPEIDKMGESIENIESIIVDPATVTVGDIAPADDDGDGKDEVAAFRLSGGVNGTRYVVTAIVTTDAGNKLEAEGILDVVNL